MASRSRQQVERTIPFTGKDLPTPDTSLIVFDVDFQVHSIVLKRHSQFFATFLDSADKSSSSNGPVKYEWITKVEDNGRSWSLIALENSQLPSTVDENIEPQVYQYNTDREVRAFNFLLCAMYGRNLGLDGAHVLCTATDLADYYRTLPTLSKSVDAALRRNPLELTDDDDMVKVLDAAYQLRHADLFRDCISLLAGKIEILQGNQHGGIGNGLGGFDINSFDLKYQPLLSKARASVTRRVSEATQNLLNTPLGSEPVGVAISKLKVHNPYVDEEITLPVYFRRLYEAYDVQDAYWQPVREALHDVLSNGLLLEQSPFILAGKGEFQNRFLCADWVLDDDIPWDRTQKDW
ncbi:uncharacterized protein PAC_05440 [Phialocephala subalpina]|uniref:BTB domain-containing protein n=1 Tax=Phialocephala subalpina TaxID=576137 RepID=A0A1L7WS15_9HELO|nr:uncharacterized protein PAC_05440 [Phialocephala subalpina]